MPELPMATSLAVEIPAVLFEQSDDVSDLHALTIGTVCDSDLGRCDEFGKCIVETIKALVGWVRGCIPRHLYAWPSGRGASVSPLAYGRELCRVLASLLASWRSTPRRGLWTRNDHGRHGSRGGSGSGHRDRCSRLRGGGGICLRRTGTGSQRLLPDRRLSG